jgi:post-segregation antitoxin (ccd killing protein)
MKQDVIKMTDVTSISLPTGLRTRAIEMGINISLTSRDAIRKKIQQEERKARGIAAKQTPGTTTVKGGE